MSGIKMSRRKIPKDLLGRYKLEIPKGKGKILTKEEEMELVKRYRESSNSNISMRNTLFWANAPFVLFFIQKLQEKNRLYGVEIQEAIAEGMFGLLEAIEKVNPYHQNPKRLAGYAEYFMLSRVRGLTNLTRNIPISTSSSSRKFTEKIRELEQNLGRQPRGEEIDKYLHLQFPDYKKCKIEIPQTVSLDDEDEYGVKLGDKLIRGDNGGGFDKIEAKIDADIVFKLLENSSIPQKYQEMFKMKYGCGDGGRPMRLEEIAQVFGISRQAVSSHIIKIIKALRKKIKIHPLLDNEKVISR